MDFLSWVIVGLLAGALAKYITKGFENRRLKGARVWSCSRSWSIGAVSRTGSGTVSGWYWRQKVRAWLKERGVEGEERAVELWGPGWQYSYAQSIKATRLVEEITFPSARHAFRARGMCVQGERLNRRGEVWVECAEGSGPRVFPHRGYTLDHYLQLADDERARAVEIEARSKERVRTGSTLFPLPARRYE